MKTLSVAINNGNAVAVLIIRVESFKSNLPAEALEVLADAVYCARVVGMAQVLVNFPNTKEDVEEAVESIFTPYLKLICLNNEEFIVEVNQVNETVAVVNIITSTGSH